MFLVSLNYNDEGDILIFFVEMNRSQTEIPTLPLPVCSQKAISTPDGIPYFLYHFPAVTVDQALLLPDLEITVDFDPLLAGLSGMFQLSARTQFPLVVGLSNEIQDDVAHTVPVTFIPGVNMAASYIWGIRQIYTNGILAALGMFEVSMWFY